MVAATHGCYGAYLLLIAAHVLAGCIMLFVGAYGWTDGQNPLLVAAAHSAFTAHSFSVLTVFPKFIVPKFEYHAPDGRKRRHVMVLGLVILYVFVAIVMLAAGHYFLPVGVNLTVTLGIWLCRQFLLGLYAALPENREREESPRMRATNEAYFRDEEAAIQANRRRVTFAAQTTTTASPTAAAAAHTTGVGEERKESGSTRSALRHPEVAVVVHWSLLRLQLSLRWCRCRMLPPTTLPVCLRIRRRSRLSDSEWSS
jgi:hypothetical protein